MTSEERAALLALWADVPETRPKRLSLTDTAAYMAAPDMGGLDVWIFGEDAAALARDAIEEWLLRHECTMHFWDGKYRVRMPKQNANLLYTWTPDNESRLLAGIAGVRTFAGKPQKESRP